MAVFAQTSAPSIEQILAQLFARQGAFAPLGDVDPTAPATKTGDPVRLLAPGVPNQMAQPRPPPDLGVVGQPDQQQELASPWQAATTPAAAPDADAIVAGAQAAANARTASPIETGSMRPPPMAPRRAERSPLDYGLAFLSGLSGEGGLRAVRGLHEQGQQRNATHDALIQRGVTPELARAMTLNPAMLQAILPSVFSPRTQIVNNRLVDSQTGRVIADLSDRFAPLPEGAGVLNTATGQATGGGLPKPPAGFEWVNPQDRSAGLRAIPGGPGTHISSEVAGRLALMRTAKQGVKDARGVYERAWSLLGDFRRQGAANIPLVGDFAPLSGDQGIAQRNIRTAVEAALRTMTGAAAPETEVTRYTSLFTPGARDTIASAKQKLDALDAFMTEADNLATQGRTSNPAPAGGRGTGVRTYNPQTGRLE